MLVLTREIGDAIVFDELGITITILRSEGRKVRLGIDAPKSVRVRRKELQRGAVPEDRQPQQ